MKRIIAMLFVGVMGCGPDPLVGDWAVIGHDITIMGLPATYDATASFTSDKSVAINFTFILGGSPLLQAGATGTWSHDNKNNLTLNLHEVTTSTASAMAFKQDNGDPCVSTTVVGTAVAVCFRTTQTNGYTVNSTTLNTIVGYYMPSVPPTDGSIELTLTKK